MADTIKLKPVDQMGASLLPGELVIDEAGRVLYLDDGVAGPLAIPLDFGAIPAAPRPLDNRAILVLGAEGPEWAVLQSTGGGPTISDVPGWFVPGAFFARDWQTITVGATLETAFFSPFALTEDVSIRRLLVVPNGGSLTYHFGIADLNGNILVAKTANAASGYQQASVEVPLTVGRYQTFLYADAAMDFRSLGYTHPWLPKTAHVEHPVLLRLN